MNRCWKLWKKAPIGLKHIWTSIIQTIFLYFTQQAGEGVTVKCVQALKDMRESKCQVWILFIHLSIHPSIQLFIHPSINSFIYLFSHSFIFPSINSFIHSLIHSFIHLFIHFLLINLFNQSSIRRLLLECVVWLRLWCLLTCLWFQHQWER